MMLHKISVESQKPQKLHSYHLIKSNVLIQGGASVAVLALYDMKYKLPLNDVLKIIKNKSGYFCTGLR